MINKQTASLLYGHSFQLQDKEGVIYQIEELIPAQRCKIKSVKTRREELIGYEEIGKDYFIRCRSYDQLTKPMENGEVPIVELANIEHSPFKIEEVIDIHSSTDGKTLWVDCVCDETGQEMRFCFCIDSFQKGFISYMSHWIVKHQPELWNKFYSYHFKPSVLTDEMCVWID